MKVHDIGSALLRSAFLGSVSVLAITSAGCGAPTSHQQSIQKIQGLTIETVRLQTIPDELEVSGSVIAAAMAQLAARMTGNVTQVAVREGDAVKPGQLLAQLDEGELLARKDSTRAALQMASAGVTETGRAVAVAQAQADIAKKTYDRYLYLRDQKSVSPQEFDEVEAKQLAAQAGLEQAKAKLQQVEASKTQAESEARIAEEVASYAQILAPFDGRVSRRMVEPGSLVTPGMPLFIVEDTSHYQLDVMLPTDAVTVVGKPPASIRRGSIARMELDAILGKSFSGRVAEIEAGADPGSHTVRARIELPRDPAIQSGLFGRAWFHRGNRRAIVVSNSAVIERGQLRGVYITDSSGDVRWRVVTLGQKMADQVEVLSGLGEGEHVVLNPGSQELDGKKVGTTAADGRERTR
jgi:RND family efflux transporter MFP subunit